MPMGVEKVKRLDNLETQFKHSLNRSGFIDSFQSLDLEDLQAVCYFSALPPWVVRSPGRKAMLYSPLAFPFPPTISLQGRSSQAFPSSGSLL